MASVCFYFQVHQPYRLRRFSIFHPPPTYFDNATNSGLIRRVAEKCYRPATRLLLELVRRHDGKFRVAFSLTGVVLEQLEREAPDVLETFRLLADTGAVEFLAETYYHSLAFLYSLEEWNEQIKLHAEAMRRVFGQTPTAFRNTELTYNNDVAAAAAKLGYHVVLCEGVDHLLGYRSPANLYTPPGLPTVRLLLKHYRLSDDIAFRFSNREWEGWPLTAEKFARAIDSVNGRGDVVNLFMDYETFGEHQWADTGIFDFLAEVPRELLKLSGNDFVLPSECAKRFPPRGEYDAPHMTSWADTERDLSAWLGNPMQANALYEVFSIEPYVKAANDASLLEDWRRLQTSDHFYYMCTKYFADAAVHQYFNPYDSPYDSYINYMNVIDNLRSRLGLPVR